MLKKQIYLLYFFKMFKLDTTTKLLFATPLLLLVLPVAFRNIWLLNPRLDELDKAARQLSGEGAIDCGYSALDGYIGDGDAAGERILANACAMRAYKARHPFRVRFADRNFGTRSFNLKNRLLIRHRAIVGTQQGKLYVLSSQTFVPQMGSWKQSRTYAPIKRTACASLTTGLVNGFPTPQILCK